MGKREIEAEELEEKYLGEGPVTEWGTVVLSLGGECWIEVDFVGVES